MLFDRTCDRVAAGVVAALVLASLVLALLLPSGALLAAANTDLIGEFVSSRAFLADSLRHGQLPLWNPYTYGGQPFLAGFEAAELYPPNLVFLLLPLVPALNFSILFHLVILGWGMERWATARGLGPGPAALAGFVLPLSGAVFPHVYAGHLSNLCTMAWAPWIFLGLESWVRQGRSRGLFLASAAMCLQILAGHVQYFFYTAVAAGLEAIVLSIAHPEMRGRALPAVAGCYLAAVLLGAAQLLPGLASSADCLRGEKLDYKFAAMFGFPPENFLTILAPGFFGSLGTPVYWGRCYLWEMSLFFGAVGPLLIGMALCDSRRDRRFGVMLDLIVAALLLVLASGVHTPVFDLLYRFAPGFGHFRSWSKFIFPATLFLVLATATGADALCRGQKAPLGLGLGGLALGLILGVAALFFLADPESVTALLGLVAASGESYLPVQAFTQPSFIEGAATHAGLSLGLAALVLDAAGGALLLARVRPAIRWALPVLLAAEMIGFAAGQVTFSGMSDAMPPDLAQFVAAHPGDYRVLDVDHANNGFLLGAGDLGGNNPSVLRRYAEFINFTQGEDPDHPTQYLPFKSFVPLYAMLRLRYAFLPDSRGVRVLASPTPPLPRLLLVNDCRVLPNRDAIFSAMRASSFDPAKTVLLESATDPTPDPAATGKAELISERADELTIETDVDRPTLLLVTDLYDPNWRAEALPDSSQASYHLMPADYVLRAVPLAAGHHHLRLVYAPRSFPIGVGISMAAWAIWAALLFSWGKRQGKSARPKAP
jgi:hypothetical protein